MKKLQLIFILFFVFFSACSVQAEDEYNLCKVVEVIDGKTFKCENDLIVKIWGIDLSQEEKAGNKSKDYLKSYILNETLKCTPKGMRKDGIVGRCIKDLKVKSIDIADPLIIGGYATEDKEKTKGYYSNPNRPRSQ